MHLFVLLEITYSEKFLVVIFKQFLELFPCVVFFQMLCLNGPSF